MRVHESRGVAECPGFGEGRVRMPICTETPGDGLTTVDGRPVSGIDPGMVPIFRKGVAFRWPKVRKRAWLGLHAAAVPAERAGYPETVPAGKFADSRMYTGCVRYGTATDPAGELRMPPMDERFPVPDNRPAVGAREAMPAATRNAVKTLVHAFRTAASGKGHSDAELPVDVPEWPRTRYRTGQMQEIRAQLRQVA